MGIKVALEHRTSYTFDRLVEVYPHVVRLRPAPHSRTPIEAYSLQVEPGDHFINWQQDAFGNFLARLVFPTRARSLTITVGLIADMKVINPFDFFIEDWAEHIGFEYPKPLTEDLKPYLRPVDEEGEGSGPGDLTQAWVKNFSVAPGTRTIDFLVALNRAVNADVGYNVRMEPGADAGSHPAHRDRVVSRLGVATRVDPAPDGPGGALRLGLPGAADLRCRGARRPVRAGRRLHRPARLDRGVHPRRGMDRAGPDVGSVRGRGPHSAVGHAAPGVRGADHRCDRTVRDDAGLLQRRHPRARGSAGHVALHRDRAGRHLLAGRPRRRAAGRR